ncbi:sugar phosphate isomerase/epimerase [Halomonas elongata]|uniref:sugar phosphate isomerase/epimerase family protein n=1 Tax=Halomonas elongata TaxID=2746 RepID=UPI00334485A3
MTRNKEGELQDMERESLKISSVMKRVSIMASMLMMGSVVTTPAIATEESQDLPIAVQMYTMRDHGSTEEQFAAVNRAGIKAIETVGDHGVSAERMNELLEAYDLDIIASHVGLDEMRSDSNEVVDFNKAVGNDTIVIPYLEEDARPDSASGWKELGKELGSMAEKLDKEDMALAYHNHDFEMQEYGDKTALELLFDAAGPALKSEIDLAWVERAGLDPAEYVTRFDGRLFAVHAKDNAPQGEATEEGGFTSLGNGVLDWETILPAVEEAGAKWYIIEHDHPLDPEDVITVGNRFLKNNL